MTATPEQRLVKLYGADIVGGDLVGVVDGKHEHLGRRVDGLMIVSERGHELLAKRDKEELDEVLAEAAAEPEPEPEPKPKNGKAKTKEPEPEVKKPAADDLGIDFGDDK